MSILNGLLNLIGEAMFLVVSWLGPVPAILALSLLFTVGSLLLFRRVSDQERITAAKGPMKAHLFGIVLFRHDLRVVFKALLKSFWLSIANLRFLVKPMAVLIVPLFLLFVQMEVRLGVRSLAVGEAAVLRVHLREGASPDDVALEAPDGVARETPGVRVVDPEKGLREVDFRIRAKAEGVHRLIVRTPLNGGGATSVDKRVTVARDRAPLSSLRPGAGIFTRLLHPTEPPLPGDSPVASIELDYRPRTYPFLGIDWAWWVLFLAFMIVALFALKGPLGVDF